MKEVYFVTTSDYKFEQFTNTLREMSGLAHMTFQRLAEETPEIQAGNNEAVAKFSARFMADKYGVPCIKEDIGFYIDALDGFPGVFLAFVDKQIKSEGYLKLLAGKQNRNAHWQYSIAYCEPGQDPVCFSIVQPGEISEKVAGSGGWYADKICIHQDNLTIAQLLDQGTYVRDNRHYRQLVEFLKNHGEDGCSSTRIRT